MAAAIQVASLFGTLRLDKSQFEKDVQGAGGMFDSLGSVAGKAGRAIAAGVTVGAVAITGLSIKGVHAAMDWETAFAGVKKTMDTVGMSAQEEAAFFKGLEDQLRSMAKEIPIAHAQLAAVAEAAGALGVKAEDIEEFTRTAALLGVTTDVSADRAATALGKINAVMPFTQGEFERFGNTLVDLGNKGASTEAEIVEMAQRMSGAAALVGLSKDQLLAWASAAANVGIRSEAGGSSFQKFALGVNSMTSSTGKLRAASVLGNVSIKQILASASKGPKAFTAMAAKLGMTNAQLRKLIGETSKLDRLADVAGMTAKEFTKLYDKDASAALQKVVNGLSGMSKAQKQATLEALGFKDLRITQYLLTLSANTDNLNDSLANGATAWEENAAMTEEARKRFETTESKIALLKNVANDAAITFGTALLPAIGDIVEKASDLITVVGDWMTANSELMDTFAPIIAGVAGIISTLAGASILGSVLGPVAPMLGGIGAAAGLLLSPLGLLALGVGALALAFTMDFEEIERIAGKILPKVQRFIRELVGKLQTWAREELPKIVDEMITKVGAFVDKLAAWVQENGPAIAAEAAKMAGELVDGFIELMIGDEGLLIKLGAWLADDFIPWLGENGPALAKGAADLAGQLVQGFLDVLFGDEGLAWKVGDFIVNTLIPEIGKHGPGILQKAGDIALELITGFIEMLTGKGEQPGLLAQMGTWIVEEALPWIAQLAPLFAAKAVDVASALVAGFIDLIAGDEGLLSKLGPFVDETLLPWIGDVGPKLLDKGIEIAGDLVDGLLDVVLGRNGNRGLLGLLQDFVDQTLIPGIKQWGPQLLTVATDLGKGLLNGVVDGLKNLGPRLADIVTEAIRGLIRIVVDGINLIIDAWNALEFKIPEGSFRLVAGGEFGLPGTPLHHKWDDWTVTWPGSDDLVPNLGRVKMPKFDTGAWRLPGDMIAALHQDEMVVPAAAADEIRADARSRDWRRDLGMGTTDPRAGGGPLIGQQVINGVQPGDVEIETTRALRRAALGWSFGG